MIHFLQNSGLKSIHDVGAQHRHPLNLLPGPKNRHPSLKFKGYFDKNDRYANLGVLGLWSSDQLLVRSIVNGTPIDPAESGNPAFYEALYQQGVDMVVMEYNFLQPSAFIGMHETVEFITMFRDPWARYRSTYEKELDQYCVGGKHAHKKNIQESARKCLRREQNRLDHWMYLPNGLPPSSRRNRQFPGMLAPNYYIRMLNGLLDQPTLELNNSHLEAAMEVLLKFDTILYLEMNESIRDAVLRSLFSTVPDKTVSLPSKSNNYLKELPLYETIHKESLNARQYFEEHNKLDRQLYNYAITVVEARIKNWSRLISFE